MPFPVRNVSRIVAGFLGAPLVSGVLFSLMVLKPYAGFFALIFAYPFEWLLGIPAYLFLRAMGWLKFRHFLLAGTVTGGIVCVIFAWLGSPFVISPRDLMLMGLFIIHGVAVAAMFWFIAIKPRKWDTPQIAKSA